MNLPDSLQTKFRSQGMTDMELRAIQVVAEGPASMQRIGDRTPEATNAKVGDLVYVWSFRKFRVGVVEAVTPSRLRVVVTTPTSIQEAIDSQGKTSTYGGETRDWSHAPRCSHMNVKRSQVYQVAPDPQVCTCGHPRGKHTPDLKGCTVLSSPKRYATCRCTGYTSAPATQVCDACGEDGGDRGLVGIHPNAFSSRDGEHGRFQVCRLCTGRLTRGEVVIRGGAIQEPSKRALAAGPSQRDVASAVAQIQRELMSPAMQAAILADPDGVPQDRVANFPRPVRYRVAKVAAGYRIYGTGNDRTKLADTGAWTTRQVAEQAASDKGLPLA